MDVIVKFVCIKKKHMLTKTYINRDAVEPQATP